MASLQAPHTRGCEFERPWTTLASALEDGEGRRCTCKRGPLYHVVSRDDAGKLIVSRSAITARTPSAASA